MTLRRWAAGVLFLPLICLTGCTDDDPTADPDPTPSITMPTPTESQTPEEPVEPEPPAAMDGKDAKAAKAFVRYYWDVVNYAQITGDVKRLRALGYDLCDSCRAGIKSITKVYKAGGTIKGGAITVKDLEATRIQRGKVSTFSVTFSYSAAREVITYSKGAKPTKRAGGTGALMLLVRNDASDTWRVAQWDRP